jgi:hypothetical protein
MNIISHVGRTAILSFILTSGLGAQKLLLAGTLVHCRVSEKISSKVTEEGDPIVCDAFASKLPWNTTMVGTFQEYKDPGHFIGKGWMELSFDRLLLPGSMQPIPMSAKVVEGAGYHVDRDGKVLGKGHAVRDAVEWMIPVLWPIDLINLPRRGPVPVIKAETKLTLKLMEDLVLPIDPEVTYYEPPVPDKHRHSYDPPEADRYGFTQRPIQRMVPQEEYVAPAGPPVETTSIVANILLGTRRQNRYAVPREYVRPVPRNFVRVAPHRQNRP